MMRSALCPFVLAFVALLVGGCGSNDEAIDEIPVQKGSIGCLEYEIKDHIVTITDCDPSIAGKLEIPTTIETRPVNGIGQHAFERCELLTNITIPSSVTSIEVSAFRGCRSLTSITIPDSVTCIGDYAFAFCNSLTSITIPDSVTSVGEAAFRDCRSLTSITIPNSVTSIGLGAFAVCKSLTSVTFLGDAPKAGEEVFEEVRPTIYRKPEAKGWGDTFAGRPVKLISEKP